MIRLRNTLCPGFFWSGSRHSVIDRFEHPDLKDDWYFHCVEKGRMRFIDLKPIFHHRCNHKASRQAIVEVTVIDLGAIQKDGYGNQRIEKKERVQLNLCPGHYRWLKRAVKKYKNVRLIDE